MSPAFRALADPFRDGDPYAAVQVFIIFIAALIAGVVVAHYIVTRRENQAAQGFGRRRHEIEPTELGEDVP